ncbi:TPA: opacity family porin [Neisseria meningitidis]
MKKLLTALTVLALPAAAFAADSQPGVYVQGDVGVASVSIHADGETLRGSDFIPRVSVGYDTGDMRIAADYYRIRDKNDDVTATLQGAGVAVIKDFNTNAIVKPYVGARLGLNRLKAEDYKKTKVSVGALGGVGFEVAPNVTLDLGYRFNYLGKFENAKVWDHEYTAGVRVKF